MFHWKHSNNSPASIDIDLARFSGVLNCNQSLSSANFTTSLLKHDIETYYICGNYYGDNEGYGQSHAWLELSDGTIIDITGDQFKYHEAPLTDNIPVYMGPITEYYRMFDTRYGSNHEHFGLERQWSTYHELKTWYEPILNYLKWFL